MRCIVCYLNGNPDQLALVTVNGHSVCDHHISAARKSHSINVVMQRLHSNELFGVVDVANENRTRR